MSFPHTFATYYPSIALADLDANFSQLSSTSTSTVSLAGAALIGFLQSGTGAVAEDVQTMGRRMVWASQYGSKMTTTPGADINAAATALGATGGIVWIPPGAFTQEAQISVPSNVCLLGAGIGKTVITAKAAYNATGIVNSDSVGGNSNIELRDFTYDGNYTNQTSGGNGVAFTTVTNSYIEIETRNCYGTGQTFSGGSNNRAGPRNWSHGNGKTGAGYGLYIFNSDDNQVCDGGIYDDNCIGVAVEANGSGKTALRNKVGAIKARANRADFSQSGAGVHFEQGASGDASNGTVTGAVCTGGTGLGINNTSTNLHITGGTVQGNTKAGIATTNAVGFLYTGVKLLGNGAGDAVGYQAQIRFDDSGLSPASSGLVVGCYGSGTVYGVRTLSANSAVKVIACDLTGTTTDYSMAGTGDEVLTNFASGSFTATLTGVTATVTGTVYYEIVGNIVHMSIPTAILGTSNTTAATLTGAPAVCQPTAQRGILNVCTDNGSNALSWSLVETSGTITLRNGAAGAFTSSGTKGAQQCDFTYKL